MDGINQESGAHPPAPPQPPARSPQAQPSKPAPPPNPVPSQQPVPHQQPQVHPPNAPAGERKGRSTLAKVLIGLVLFSVVSFVLLIGAVVVATSVGLFDSDPVDSDASPQVSQPTATSGGSGGEADDPEELAAVEPAPLDGVTVSWDASPSSCDGNNKRSFSADLENGTAAALDVRMRILDPANNFVHQSHVYTALASDRMQVDLGGIPSGPSIVQIVVESDDEVIAQTSVRFEDC